MRFGNEIQDLIITNKLDSNGGWFYLLGGQMLVSSNIWYGMERLSSARCVYKSPRCSFYYRAEEVHLRKCLLDDPRGKGDGVMALVEQGNDLVCGWSAAQLCFARFREYFSRWSRNVIRLITFWFCKNSQKKWAMLFQSGATFLVTCPVYENHCIPLREHTS